MLDDIEATCPKSFYITNITSDGKKVTMNAISAERLLSVPALIIQLNKIPMIRNVWVEAITEDQGTKKNKFKYAYGRKVTKDKYGEEVLMLPVCYLDGKPRIDPTHEYSPKGYIPDWQCMVDIINSLPNKPLKTGNKQGKAKPLKINEWERFRLDKLFDIKKGKRLTEEDQEPGSNIYVGAIDSNNGVANRIGQLPIHSGNTISLSYNGSVGEAFYQPEPYWATDDVNVLYPRFSLFNAGIGLFMCTVIRQEQYRFSYGRKWTLDNMNETEICLPVQKDKRGRPVNDPKKTYSDYGYIPDWNFMETYMESLPYGDKLKNHRRVRKDLL